MDRPAAEGPPACAPRQVLISVYHGRDRGPCRHVRPSPARHDRRRRPPAPWSPPAAARPSPCTPSPRRR
ncbi:hypothetical protein F751_1840 [Auxenochlorella protothecoides]|uniref:Uncharacterized protein n=1 Tax=Auxenochlorella protothecoides TaxID=3075 RepID=A0A087SGV7_AUXPR|nr:hypothetical protein F751_1840 [Auxenochlorella protothecoides]KFM24961.1 hypothetical protein F751_1840 [Auxenochlorella protothecoides]